MINSSPVTIACHLVAQAGRYDELSSHFQQGGANASRPYLVVALAIAALAVVALAWWASQNNQKQHRSYRSTRRLFSELCRQHDLPWRQRRVLRQQARIQRLTSPARLFVRPECFQTDQLPESLRGEVDTLHTTLFGP
jgi:hypothetical protein